jgi:hypothetical protein
MSKFITPITPDLDAVLKRLPAGAYVEGVHWNRERRCVDIYWSHEPFRTGKDYSVEFLAAALETQLLPAGVKLKKDGETRRRGDAETEPTPAVRTPAAKTVAPHKRAKVKG